MHGRRRARLLPREEREVADDAAGARALLLNELQIALHRLRHVVLHLQQFGEAEDGLQRVVDFVRDARHELTDGGEALLPDDLALERFELGADPALLGHLRVEHLARGVEALQHGVEGVLQILELARQHRLALNRAEVSGGDPLRGRIEMADRRRQPPRQDQCHRQPCADADGEDGEVPRPDGRRARVGERGRNGDRDRPWRMLDVGAGGNLLVVRVGPDRCRRSRGVRSILRRAFRADAPGDDRSGALRNRHHRPFRHGHGGDDLLDAPDVVGDRERGRDRLRAVGHSVEERHVALAAGAGAHGQHESIVLAVGQA